MAKKIPVNYCPQPGTKINTDLLKEIKALIWGQKTDEGKSLLEKYGISVISLPEVCKYAKIEKNDDGKYNISQAQFDKAFDEMVKDGVSLITEQDPSQMDILSFYPFKEKTVQDGNKVEVQPTFPITYDENGNRIDVSANPELIQKYQDAYTRQLEVLQQTIKAQGISCIENLPPRVAAAQKELIIQTLRDNHQSKVTEANASIEHTEAKRQEVVKSFNAAKLKYDELKHTPISQLTTEGQAHREELLSKYRQEMETAKGELDELYSTHKQNSKDLKSALKEQKGLEGEISSVFGKKAIKNAEKSIEKNTNEKMTFGQHINKWVQNQKDRNLRFKAEVRNEAIATGRPVVSAALNVFIHNPPLPIIGEPIQKLSDFFKDKEGEDKKEKGIISKAKSAFSKITKSISEKLNSKNVETENEEVVILPEETVVEETVVEETVVEETVVEETVVEETVVEETAVEATEAEDVAEDSVENAEDPLKLKPSETTEEATVSTSEDAVQ